MYRGRVFAEMDLDALLWRKPQLAVVDELAHSNVEGSRHVKRYQDVEELLAAGIDVFTTLNVQHVESLNDVVERISRVRVRETLPDKVLELADEIELVDLPPDDLIARLREGKVYVRDQVGRAMQHFFGKGNLTALRELAMRVAAERVDAEMVNYMRAHAIAGPWPAQDRLLVCINESPVAKKLVRTAKRMAERSRMPWIVVNVHTPRTDSLGDEAKDRIAEALRLAESLGGEAFTLHAESDVAKELLAFARARNVSRILLGRPRRRRLSGWLREHVGRRLLRQGGPFEITIVAPEDEPAADHLIQASSPDLRPDLRAFAWTTLAVAVAIAVSHVADRFLPLANLSLIFLMAVLFAAIRFGLWPSVYTALLSFVAYNFFFTEPHHTFIVDRREDVLTMIFFLVVAVIVGNLAARLKAQVEAMRLTARRTANLYDFSRRIAGAASLNDVLWAAVHHVASTLQCQSLVLLPREGEGLEIASGYPPEDQMSPTAWGAAHWAWQHDQAAGWGSGTLPASEWLFLPLRTGRGPQGLLGVAFENPKRQLTPEQRHLLEALVDQVAVAIERTNLATDIEKARLLTETERLRSALLSSVSHDLRTPLVSIMGSATGLASCDGALSTCRPRAARPDHPRGERAPEPLRPEPARHDPARVWRLAAEPGMGRSARDRRPRAQADGEVAGIPAHRGADRGRRADPARRPDPRRAGARQRARQCRQTLAIRWSDRDRSDPRGRARHGEGKRRGPRHPGASARHGVRRVLSRARRRQAGSRNGPRPFDLPRPGRGPRRPDRGAARAGRTWHDHRLLAPGAAGARDRR